MWAQFMQGVEPYLQPLLAWPQWGVLGAPKWAEHAALAFVIAGLTMLCRRSMLCRMVVAVALLVTGVMLLDLLPPPLSGFVSASVASATQAGIADFAALTRLVIGHVGQRQFAEIALLSLGSAWLLDELRAAINTRHASAVETKRV
jgi:hypothetical protein